eukprot:scpid50670/ scgid12257/ Tubulin epsilon chain; Epsilon-tubulin
MTQSIVVQVGQCGNQIGCRFWDLALREHAASNPRGTYDTALSSFFRNVNPNRRVGGPASLPVGDGTGKIRSLKARAVLVDMEESVVNELLRGQLGEVFDCRQNLTSISGSGNNWAVGHYMYGDMYADQLAECIRRAAEECDCLQTFFLLHSMGGGTGSGLGTYVLDHLRDTYPEVYRFALPVYPSVDDDVITSPYNSLLATSHLTAHADCVLPVENESLGRITQLVSKNCGGGSLGSGKLQSKSRSQQGVLSSGVSSSHGSAAEVKSKPFDDMNNIVANLMLNLTSSSRFEGSLNVDLNEITMNLVPYPRMHYLVSSMAPLYSLRDVGMGPRSMDQVFSDALARDHQLMHADPKNNVYLACAMLLRGKVQMSDIRRNIERMRPSLSFVHWNDAGWKTGLCSVPPAGQAYSLLCLANNTCIRHTFRNIHQRFRKLYQRRAHLHHYTTVAGMEAAEFDTASESLLSLIDEYEQLDVASRQPEHLIPPLQIAK